MAPSSELSEELLAPCDGSADGSANSKVDISDQLNNDDTSNGEFDSGDLSHDENVTSKSFDRHERHQRDTEEISGRAWNNTSRNVLSPLILDSEYDSHDEAVDKASSDYVVARLKDLYRKDVLDAEKKYQLHFNFQLPNDGELKDDEFKAKPMVLLIGQYSTGKTTFISHLLGKEFLGMHIGPEPTTDKFTALFSEGDDHSAFPPKDVNDDAVNNDTQRKDEDKSRDSISTDNAPRDNSSSRRRLVKGNTLTVTPSLPFRSLSQFGSTFLNQFVGSSDPSPLLKHITIIDTPGVLSGEKQRIHRKYDFGKVTKWFADRSDLILLLFDAHKLDICDELKDVIDTILPHNEDKIRCVLNKADSVTREQLVRVYGSLMWSMGKIFNTSEVVRVYTGSFWDEKLRHSDFEDMFVKDEQLLVREILDLSRCSAERKVSQMVNRIRLAKVYICILGTLRELTPSYFGWKESREQLLGDIESILERVRITYGLSKGDIPDPKRLVRYLGNFPDFRVFPYVDGNLINRLDKLIDKDIPDIVNNANKIASEARKSRGKNAGAKLFHLKLKGNEINRSFFGKTKKASRIMRTFSTLMILSLALVIALEIAHYVSYGTATYSLSDLRAYFAHLAQTVNYSIHENKRNKVDL